MSGASQGQEVARAIEDLVKHPNQSMAATTDVPTDEASLALPPGSAIRADAASWAPDGVGGGTMIVTVTTPWLVSQEYSAVMVQQGGSWKVLATFPIGGAQLLFLGTALFGVTSAVVGVVLLAIAARRRQVATSQPLPRIWRQ